jgi:hypothetical protein
LPDSHIALGIQYSQGIRHSAASTLAPAATSDEQTVRRQSAQSSAVGSGGLVSAAGSVASSACSKTSAGAGTARLTPGSDCPGFGAEAASAADTVAVR